MCEILNKITNQDIFIHIIFTKCIRLSDEDCEQNMPTKIRIDTNKKI